MEGDLLRALPFRCRDKDVGNLLIHACRDTDKARRDPWVDIDNVDLVRYHHVHPAVTLAAKDFHDFPGCGGNLLFPNRVDRSLSTAVPEGAVRADLHLLPVHGKDYRRVSREI